MTDTAYPYAMPVPPATAKKHHIFLWVFLAVQALFIIWLITGGMSTANVAPQVASSCYSHAWYPLFSSQADCVHQLSSLYRTASDAGKGIALGVISIFWVITDLILGISYGIFKLATRHG